MGKSISASKSPPLGHPGIIGRFRTYTKVKKNLSLMLTLDHYPQHDIGR